MRKKCLEVLFSLGRGGAETTVKNYLLALKNDNELSFTVLVHKRVSDGFEKDILDSGIAIDFINHPNKSGLWNYSKNLFRYLKEEKFDVIHIHMDKMCGVISLIAKQAKVPTIICHSHTSGKSNLGGSFGIFINRVLFRIVNPIRMACGYDAGKAMYGNKQFLILNNGVNTDDFFLKIDESNSVRNQLRLSGNSKVVVHVGRFDKPKNQRFIIDLADAVIEKNNDIVFLFVGKGALWNELKELASKCKFSMNIFFLGLRNDIPAILLDSDLFVMPSEFEGLPVSAIEAQAAGLPCIVSTGVTEETNCGVNYFSFVPLDRNKWVDEITNGVLQKKAGVHECAETLYKLGYSIDSQKEYLRGVYLKRD